MALDNTAKRKVVNNFVEFYNDLCYVRDKPAANRQLKRYLKNKQGSKVWKVISASPSDIQFFTHYTDTPIESRRTWLDTAYFRLMAALHNLVLHFVYLYLWHIFEGVRLAEIKKCWEECVGRELSEVMFEEMTRQLGANEVIRFGMDTLRLSPGSIAGANARLRNVLNQRSVKQGEHKSDYEQDLSVGLWECSEGAHLDEFRKMLSDKGNLTEVATSLRQMLKEKDGKTIRSIVLRILRKTIEDLPDIHQEVRKQKMRDRESPLPDNVDTIMAETPWMQPDNLSEAEGREAIIEALAHKGIKYDDLTPKEWAEIFERHELISKGYEFSSKTGISISSFYGEAAKTKEKRWSRIKQKIDELSRKRQ